MKKLFFFLAIIVLSNLTANAQVGDRLFKKFKGDVSLGYATPIGGSSGSGGGILFAMEPKFALLDKLSVGLRIEGAVMAKFVNTGSGDYEVENAKVAASYVATADYYFTTNYSIRPFIGGGAGIFGVASDYSYNNTTFDGANTENKFGGIFRVGAEVRHFRFGIEYNIIPNSSIMDFNNTITGTSKNSYLGIKAGFCFGGGPL